MEGPDALVATLHDQDLVVVDLVVLRNGRGRSRCPEVDLEADGLEVLLHDGRPLRHAGERVVEDDAEGLGLVPRGLGKVRLALVRVVVEELLVGVPAACPGLTPRLTAPGPPKMFATMPGASIAVADGLAALEVTAGRVGVVLAAGVGQVELRPKRAHAGRQDCRGSGLLASRGVGRVEADRQVEVARGAGCYRRRHRPCA